MKCRSEVSHASVAVFALYVKRIYLCITQLSKDAATPHERRCKCRRKCENASANSKVNAKGLLYTRARRGGRNLTTLVINEEPLVARASRFWWHPPRAPSMSSSSPMPMPPASAQASSGCPSAAHNDGCSRSLWRYAMMAACNGQRRDAPRVLGHARASRRGRRARV